MLLRTITIAAALAFAGATIAPVASTAALAKDKGHTEHADHKGSGDKHKGEKHHDRQDNHKDGKGDHKDGKGDAKHK